jgi:SHS2 domain-containing protein
MAYAPGDCAISPAELRTKTNAVRFRMFETFEHTADLGLRVRAASLNELFAEAGRGLFSVIVENPETIRPEATRELRLQADSMENLFFDWLAELLYIFEAEKLALGRFEVSIAGTALDAKVAGERIESGRHVLLRELKAITYHGLVVRQSGQHWEAEVIVDI